MSKKDLIVRFSDELLPGIIQLIEQSRHKAAVFLNAETTLLYWSIGQFINEHLKENNRLEYGAKILATLSKQLSTHYGKGYSYSALTRMCKVAYSIDHSNIATLSQLLLLCSEGNTEHIELLMLNEPDIKIAQYLTELPDKQWFADKLHKARELAGMMDKSKKE